MNTKNRSKSCLDKPLNKAFEKFCQSSFIVSARKEYNYFLITLPKGYIHVRYFGFLSYLFDPK